VIGGENAISDATFQAIGEVVDDVQRIAGSSRIETSLEIMREMRNYQSPTTIFVASGSAFADALSISPYSYYRKAPIVLANAEGVLTDEAVATIRDSGVMRVIVLGGDNAVNFGAVSEQLSGINVEKIAGGNRYETNREIVARETRHDMVYDGAAIATGQNFPDALVGSALCGKNRSVMVLTSNASYDELADLLDYAYMLRDCYILGGKNAVSSDIEHYVYRNMRDAKYFERRDNNDASARFLKVHLKVEGSAVAKTGAFDIEPGDTRVIELKSDVNKCSVNFTCREYNQITETAQDSAPDPNSNIKTVTVKTKGHDLIVKCDYKEYSLLITGKDGELGDATITLDKQN
jgi:hypothetical protein